MMRPVGSIFFVSIFLFSLVQTTAGKDWNNVASPIVYMDGSGDSLSVAYNAVRNGLPNTDSGEAGALNCPNGAIAGRSWSSELDTPQCPLSPSDLVWSFAERVNCAGSINISMKVINTAVSGATMLGNFKSQSNTIGNNLAGAPVGRRQVLVFMGHNDICSGVSNKSSNCGNTDLDSSNYCFTSTGAFEREFRNGLESLIIYQNVTISVVAPGRVSQLCNIRNERMCQAALYWPQANSCSNAWKLRTTICPALTADCSNTRITDTYNYEKTYRDTLQRVASEYNSLPVGSPSKTFTFNGKTVGGAIKASGVSFVYSDAIWASQLLAADISCCDCFHASVKGQQRLADAAFNGVTCNSVTPCCTDDKTPLDNAQCSTSLITDGRIISGIQI